MSNFYELSQILLTLLCISINFATMCIFLSDRANNFFVSNTFMSVYNKLLFNKLIIIELWQQHEPSKQYISVFHYNHFFSCGISLISEQCDTHLKHFTIQNSRSSCAAAMIMACSHLPSIPILMIIKRTSSCPVASHPCRQIITCNVLLYHIL